MSGDSVTAAQAARARYRAGAVERAAAVRGHLDRRFCAKEVGNDVRHTLGRGEAIRIDVKQGDGGIAQLRIAENIAHQVLGEDSTTGADKGYFGHFGILSIISM